MGAYLTGRTPIMTGCPLCPQECPPCRERRERDEAEFGQCLALPQDRRMP